MSYVLQYLICNFVLILKSVFVSFILWHSCDQLGVVWPM